MVELGDCLGEFVEEAHGIYFEGPMQYLLNFVQHILIGNNNPNQPQIALFQNPPKIAKNNFLNPLLLHIPHRILNLQKIIQQCQIPRIPSQQIPDNWQYFLLLVLAQEESYLQDFYMEVEGFLGLLEGGGRGGGWGWVVG